MSLNPHHFASMVVRPVLRGMAEVTERKLYSKAAERLVLGTAIQESRLIHLRQLARRDGRRGPALGLFQIEPATHRDVWENYVRYRDEIDFFLKQLIPWHKGSLQVLNEGPMGRPVVFGWPKDNLLVWNLAYACAIARLVYYRAPARLPAADDLEGLGAYWKRYYNTTLGAGDDEEFVKAYVENTPPEVFASDYRVAWTAARRGE